MTSRGGRGLRLGLALVVSALVLGQLAPAAAAPDTSRTYPGAAFSEDFPTSPTQAENQSKLWFHAGSWWGLLVEPTGRTVRVFELMPDHTWRPTSAVVSTDAVQAGDALRDGNAVHVVTRVRSGDLQYARFTFDADAREYQVVTREVALARGGNASPTIAKDVAGRLWIGYANGRRATVIYSDNGRAWARPIDLAATGDGSTAEVAAIIAYDDRVGLMWSNQTTDSFEFASHRAGDDPTVWTREEALSGAQEAGDHISLVRVPDDGTDTLVAAVKTARNDVTADPDEPLITLLVRDPAGQWSAVPAATVGDGLNEPLLQVDPTTGTLHLFASVRSGDIVVKRAPIDDIRFESNIGDLFILGAVDGRLLNPTGTKDAVDARSGLVILASDADRRTYRHAESPVGAPIPVADPDDQTPPDPPVGLQGGAVSSETVILSWSPGADQTRWVPAGVGPPVTGYVVSRDGLEIATSASTSLRDTPRSGPASDEVAIEYWVQAVDEAGNRSTPARVTVSVPAAPGSLPVVLGLASLALAGLAAAYRVHRRTALNRQIASGPPPEPALVAEPTVTTSARSR